VNTKQKNLMTALIITIGFCVIASLSINSSSPRTNAEPPDFYQTSKEVSLEEMIEIANKGNLLIYLPSELPGNLKIMAIYLKESPFIAIIVFSAENNKDYITAELTVEIAPVNPKWVPSYNELHSEAEMNQDKTALEINTWPAIIHENADIGGYSERRSKFGDYTMLANVWIDNIGYLFCAPTLEFNEIVATIESMFLLNA
jgi:hypothetical protein